MKAFQFCLPVRGTKVPSGPDWLHEIKYDGYRLLVRRENDRVRLLTMNGHDWADRYPRGVIPCVAAIWEISNLCC
jgi:bifunctional non-homologous end joining protein LigD